ncbi:DNA polymerase [Mastadenovirus eidoli]|uniref:DNA polymerase n=1 Tax=Eidolon helvum adenovirus TaxID=2039267 RepID=A0A348FKF9_9ADEN|nr:DNA polymerase [Eidolon helvum adenovirus]BBF72826.1 DNA polymerase [Eidolon helvum adenovirus]
MSKLRCTYVAQRACGIAQGIDEQGTPIEIKYFNNLESSLQNLFKVNLTEIPSHLHSLNHKNLIEKIEQTCPTSSSVYVAFKSRFKVISLNFSTTLVHFPLNFLVKNHKVFLIRSVETLNKCEDCGRFFKTNHSCSLRRRDYYYHHINVQTCDWWENISFKPIGSCKETKKVFIIYDVETYTWHGKFGKQLVPFMLVFHIYGDEQLVKTCCEIADKEKWNRADENNTFYYINPQKREIGNKFKIYRELIQKHVIMDMWDKIVSKNPSILKLRDNLNLQCAYDIPQEDFFKLHLEGSPTFIEIYIVGHNINGFDEIVLAAQVINNNLDIPLCFKVMRNFMPRCGKILFNDITFALPNPEYESPGKSDFEQWEKGICESRHLKFQTVKIMVRDTFALTNTSLKNAAAAYNLPVEKGACPYQALNEFYMFGSYLTDIDGFPVEKYWQSPEEYTFNKNLWKNSNKKYDIIKETLKYCILDVIVTAKLVEKLQDSYQTFICDSVNLPECNFNVFERPTISSNSHAIFKQIVYRAEKPSSKHIGKILVAPSKEMYEYVRSSIRGGRCYPNYLGILKEPIYVYDICGMYASALTHPFPVGLPLSSFDCAVHIQLWKQYLSGSEQISYFNPDLLPGIFTIDADPPDEQFLDVLPPYCSKKGGRLCWTNEPLRNEVATSIDLITLHNRGWKVDIIPDKHTTIFPEWKCVAAEYVQLNILAKEKADKEKNQTLRSIAKLLSNALYGSFATKLDNKKTVFSDQIDASTRNKIANGTYFVKASSFIETDTYSAEILPEFKVHYSPDTTSRPHSPVDTDSDDDNQSLNTQSEHVTYVYKPITFLDVDDNDACLHTLELNSPLVTNNRYPSQIASFVLAWTRAFVSEWAGFLYEEDKGIPIKDRPLKSVYGDTDSLFVTERGRFLMETKGKHRLKKNGGNLIFDPKNPSLTWLVECETQCKKCGEDAYSSESVFLAPKLYALKNICCQKCGFVGPGKLRAKGHATKSLSFDLMSSCYYTDVQEGNEKYQTSRTTLKRTLASCQTNAQPFTVMESTLTRKLRPWKDKTLVLVDQHKLIPYSKSNPNPRNMETYWTELPWDM